MRSSWLYLAIRSERLSEPVLICPAFVPTAMSAMVASSVSPERWLITEVQPARLAISIAAKVSVRVPIWLILIRIELATFLPDAFLQDLGVGDEQVVADELHLRLPSRSLSSFQPSQSPSCHAVLDRDDRVLADPARERVDPLGRGQRQAFAVETVLAFLVELAGGAVEADRDLRARLCSRPSRSPRGSSGSRPRGWRRSARTRPRRRPRCSCRGRR